MLARGGTLAKARRALKVLQTDYVDWNDVRVTSSREIASKIAELVGQRLRSRRPRSCIELLTMIYHRFNRINLDFLQDGESDADAGREPAAHAPLRDGCPSARSPGRRCSRCTPPRSPRSSSTADSRASSRGSGSRNEVDPPAIRERDRSRSSRKTRWSPSSSSAYVLSEDFCHAKIPDCPECPAKSLCPSARRFIKALQEAAEKKETAREGPGGARARQVAAKAPALEQGADPVAMQPLSWRRRLRAAAISSVREGLDFQVARSPHVDESVRRRPTDPAAAPSSSRCERPGASAMRVSDGFVLGADTVVWADG